MEQHSPVAPTRPLHVSSPINRSTLNFASSSYASTFFVIFHSLPASVPGPSYASGSGPVNSWYDDGAATMYPCDAIWRAKRATGPVTKGRVSRRTQSFVKEGEDRDNGNTHTLVNFAEDDDTGEFGLGISGNCRMEGEDAYIVFVSSNSCCRNAFRISVRMLPPAFVCTSWWDSVISIISVVWRDVEVGVSMRAMSCELDVDGSGGGGVVRGNNQARARLRR
jgi:hypothetical protein